MEIHENLFESNKFWFIQINFLVESTKYFVRSTKYFIDYIRRFYMVELTEILLIQPNLFLSAIFPILGEVQISTFNYSVRDTIKELGGDLVLNVIQFF